MPADVDGPLSGWAHDPELAAAGAAYRAELRAEAAAYEELAARDRLRGRTLADVAAEALARGDLVTITVVGRAFTGTVTHTAGDLACLRTPAGEDVDVHLAGVVALRVARPARAGGRSRGQGPASFAARLGEHEASGVVLEIGARTPEGGLVGRVEAVAADHVVVTDVEGARCFLARAAIDYVLPRRT